MVREADESPGTLGARATSIHGRTDRDAELCAFRLMLFASLAALQMLATYQNKADPR